MTPIPEAPKKPEEQIHYEDPRYPMWLKVYDLIVADAPPELRKVLQSSAGSLASKIVNELFPVPSRTYDFSKVLDAARKVSAEPCISADPNSDLRAHEVANLRIAIREFDRATDGVPK